MVYTQTSHATKKLQTMCGMPRAETDTATSFKGQFAQAPQETYPCSVTCHF